MAKAKETGSHLFSLQQERGMSGRVQLPECQGNFALVSVFLSLNEIVFCSSFSREISMATMRDVLEKQNHPQRTHFFVAAGCSYIA